MVTELRGAVQPAVFSAGRSFTNVPPIVAPGLQRGSHQHEERLIPGRGPVSSTIDVSPTF